MMNSHFRVKSTGLPNYKSAKIMLPSHFNFEYLLSMGSILSARCCQMVTSAVVFIHVKNGFFTINYLDDLGGADTAERATASFNNLRDILQQMGLQEAVSKTVSPCTLMVFLGIEVNTITFNSHHPC